jgi:16S rRNA (cytosine967-C5)-methyltransferase
MRARCVRVEEADAAAARDDGLYDRVLIDPPCSGLGTLQSRPDVRWRASPESIAELAEIQYRILCAGARVAGDGGALVYSVCTISRAEGPALIERFLAERSGFVLEESRQLFPHRDGTDGFFIARLRRA